MRRFRTHIVMVSEQQIPNVLPVVDNSIRPERAVICTTPGMRGNAKILTDYFSRCQIQSSLFELDSAYDFVGLQNKFLDLASELSGQASDTGVNLTCGTKLMAIAAQKVFWENGFPCFYVNPEKNTIINVTEGVPSESPIAGQLGIDDVFAVHGYRVVSSERKQISEKTDRLCRTLLSDCSRYEEPLKTLNRLAGEAEDAKSLTVRHDIPAQSWDLLKLFMDHGAIRYYDDNKIQFADEGARRFCHGFWLEDWVGGALNELNRRVKLQDYRSSIVIESGNGTRNEIDAAFLYRNQLYLTECKTASLDENDKSAPPLYKLDSLHRLPGSFTRMILTSYQPLDIHGRRRAEDLRIRVIDQGSLLGLATCMEKMLVQKEN